MFKIVNDSNYLAKVVQLKEFRKHEGADKLLIWNVNNYEVITDLNYEIGDTVVFFPVECVINPDLLKWLNMFEKKDLNRDEVKGYVHHSGRVRAIKLRGIVSEGIVIKFDKFAEWLVTRGYTAKPEFVNFDYFDKLWICKKYTPVVKTASTGNGRRTPKTIDVLVDGQFAFHGKTEKLQDNLHKITPSDIINVSVKLHGTSAVYSNVLIKRKLSFFEKLASNVFNIVKEEYSKMYSSRTVLKYIEKVFKKDGGFYATDFWGTVYNDIKDSIEEGYSIYGEIVGQIAGSFVQKGYDYRNLIKDNTYGFFVYKITYTTPKGTVIELSWQQMQEYCKKHNLNLVPTVYFGNASGHVPFYQDTVEEWQESFIKHLRANIEVKCHYCTNDVPFEGYVVRKENANPLRLKIKSKNFLAYETKQLDAGEQDTEEGN